AVFGPQAAMNRHAANAAMSDLAADMSAPQSRRPGSIAAATHSETPPAGPTAFQSVRQSQARAGTRRRRLRSAAPSPPKPSSIIAQVAGSGIPPLGGTTTDPPTPLKAKM